MTKRRKNASVGVARGVQCQRRSERRPQVQPAARLPARPTMLKRRARPGSYKGREWSIFASSIADAEPRDNKPSYDYIPLYYILAPIQVSKVRDKSNRTDRGNSHHDEYTCSNHLWRIKQLVVSIRKTTLSDTVRESILTSPILYKR